MTNSPHPDLVLLIDAASRLRGRLKEAFAAAGAGLPEMEGTVLSAVAEARRPPTVPQIGRSLGHPRQVIQRAANRLAELGLIAMTDNPDHKRASLLVATAAGRAVKADANARAGAIAADLMRSVDGAAVRQASALLDSIRRQIEAHSRTPPE